MRIQVNVPCSDHRERKREEGHQRWRRDSTILLAERSELHPFRMATYGIKGGSIAHKGVADWGMGVFVHRTMGFLYHGRGDKKATKNPHRRAALHCKVLGGNHAPFLPV